MKTLSCFLVAFSFTINLFPIYSGLKKKTNQNCQYVVNLAIGTVFFIYLLLSISCCLLFGETVTAKDANVILNINEEYKIDRKRWESFILRVLFMVVLACHIPFVFFSGKEAMLIIVDEINRRSISKTLDERVKQLQMIDQTGRSTFHPVSNRTSKKTMKEVHEMKEVLPTHSLRESSQQTNVRHELQGLKKESHISIVRETQTLRSHAVEGGTLAYKDMKNSWYYGCTLTYFMLCVLGSCFIPKIDVVIEFVAVICVNCMSFIFPSVFYLKASKRYFTLRQNTIRSFRADASAGIKKRNMVLELASWF